MSWSDHSTTTLAGRILLFGLALIVLTTIGERLLVWMGEPRDDLE